jgi:hypothetical protein
MMTVGDTIKKNDRGHQIHAYQIRSWILFYMIRMAVWPYSRLWISEPIRSWILFQLSGGRGGKGMKAALEFFHLL